MKTQSLIQTDIDQERGSGSSRWGEAARVSPTRGDGHVPFGSRLNGQGHKVRQFSGRLLAATLVATLLVPTQLVVAQPSATPAVPDAGTPPSPPTSGAVPAADDASNASSPVGVPALVPATGPVGGPITATPTGDGLGSGGATLPRLVLTQADKDVLKDVEQEFDRFQERASEHQARMREIMVREYHDRTRKLERRFAERMAKLEAEKGRRHSETIAGLERFIAEHPNQERFTPDAMFRLADLYLDQADMEIDNRPADITDPAAFNADYSKSIALWEQIVTRFPSYRQLPSTLYLLAYYSKTANPRRSLTLFLALGCANRFKHTDAPMPELSRKEAMARTESRRIREVYADCKPMAGADIELVRHTWVRGIADYHFMVPGELDEAIAGYLKVADGGDESPLYAESLYKLAWSFYKRDFLQESIKRFDQSIKIYDEVVARGGTPALELRDEAIQYIAVGFTDPWEGEADTDPDRALQRARDFYKGRENEPHVRDVWVALGRAFLDLQAYDQAVDAFRVAIGPPWELNPQNPVVHQEIVNTFDLKGDKFAADNAAAELATRYAPGSAWHAANEKDREAMESQRRIAERALYAAARNMHTSATTARKEYDAASQKSPEEKENYLAMYAKAVDLYRQFIHQFPESDYVYEFTFMQGEALYFSERYMEAVEQYKWVRDHRDMSEQYFVPAAQSILLAYEAEAKRQVDAGKLAALKVPSGAELKALPQPFVGQPIPEIYALLQAEWDNYQNLVPDPKSAPQQGINAALVSLAYLHIDDSVARFQKVMDKFCGNPEAVRAKDGLLSIYEATDRLDKFEDTNKRFITAKCGDAKSIELAQSQNRSIEFKRASDKYRDKEYIPAAEAFYRYYKSAPAGDQDLPVALYNAAVSYKLGERPKTAIALFKEFTENKDKRFRESAFYLDAKRLTALSYQAAFQYDKAIATYLELYDVAKRAKRLGIKAPEPLPGEQPISLDQLSNDALYNAAFAAELNRDFKQAVQLYTRYEKEEPDRKKKDNAAWSIANIYRSSGDGRAMVDQYDRWRLRYGKDAGNEERMVESYYLTAAFWKRKGRDSAAEKAGAQALETWRAKGAVKAGKAAQMAGEWSLFAAERFYDIQFEPYAITKAARTIEDVKKQRKDLEAITAKTQEKYKEVGEFGIPEYSMAAKVRFGETVYKYAAKLADAPIPVPIAKNPDAVAMFEEKRDGELKKYLDEAKAQWVEVVEVAKRAGISNQWSQLAMENLGREYPGEFQLLRQELIEGTEAP